ncbi:hypothetical protein Pla123a_26920 [Posidoniimonas polymericola]|uniref:Peptidase MA-like domain-containing protein n=1 Tax=Posidoniimonas polymericola TaxID=2528002 RepID=A0A5C5YMC8_9BACT|nr:hypothetical protein [Posidoniimonas polymericola]TWT75908.1 hypothetical protein Pla123a_26920 [Posidoniimonas polymericola]
MDAHWTTPAAHAWRRCRFLFAAVLLGLSGLAPPAADAAVYRTDNFVVYAQTNQLAQEIGLSAEKWRKKLAIEWLGKEMPHWAEPCPIKTKVSPRLGAGGATSFLFDRGEVYGWEMNVQGSRERVLDSVLPHEITHTVFASHFRRPLPRWADEGACTTVEHKSEIAVQERLLIKFLKTGKGIPFDKMFEMKEYPPDVMPLYSQGHSLTQFLIERRGKAAFLEFIADGMQDENWQRAIRTHYGNEGLLDLQATWLGWVKDGRPRLAMEPDPRAIAGNASQQTGGVRLASNTTPITPAKPATASSGDSVYAKLNRTPRTANSASTSGAAASRASVYDSRSHDIIRR